MRINSNTQIQSLNFNNQRASAINTSIKLNSSTDISTGEPKIIARNEYRSELSVLSKEIRTEYYSQAVAIDRTFGNPKNHIKDKYQNSDSPYFRSDLTEHERNIAYRHEVTYLETGDAGDSYYDPFVRKIIGSVNSTDEDALEKAFNRQQINGQFSQLLEKNNLTVPDDVKLTFTIDPYNKKVEVSGTDDIQLISSLEIIMGADNGEELFSHIRGSERDNNTQFTSEKEQKYSIFSDIKRETGYDLNELKVQDGKFITPDGTDVAVLFKQAIKDRTDFQEDWIKPFIIGDMYNKLENLAKKGFDSLPDLVLSIDYENGSFRDIGQSKGFGTGETDWIVDKAASIQKEKISKQIKELLEKDNTTIPKGTKLTFILNPDSHKVEVHGTDDTNLSTLLETLLNEESAKELFLYIILDQINEDSRLTYDTLESFVKNGFDLMNGQMLSIDYEDGSLTELSEKIDWLNNVRVSTPNVDIYV